MADFVGRLNRHKNISLCYIKGYTVSPPCTLTTLNQVPNGHRPHTLQPQGHWITRQLTTRRVYLFAGPEETTKARYVIEGRRYYSHIGDDKLFVVLASWKK